MQVEKHIILPADPSDPEDFDVTPEALERGQRARLIRQTRAGLGLSQVEFANRFRVRQQAFFQVFRAKHRRPYNQLRIKENQ